MMVVDTWRENLKNDIVAGLESRFERKNGAHDRDRTGEPLPYQGSALPTELRGPAREQAECMTGKMHRIEN